jgi:hypothetical protein
VRVVCPALVPDVKIVTEKDNPHLSVPFPPNWYDMTMPETTPIAKPLGVPPVGTG